MRGLLFLFLIVIAGADDRPNILWITCEDASTSWFGCYGNDQAYTPHIDALAERGLRFDRAYSSAPVCAVARGTLLMGMHATALGTQHMRSRYPVPESLKPGVALLKDAGYYCSNNVKTDYNMAGDDRRFWHDSSRTAHFRNCPPDQPFFSVMNLTVSHESSLFPHIVARNRERATIPAEPRLSPAEIQLPPYLPDLPEMRQDFAIYHDVITALDQQVADILTELADSGRADDTIVFFFSDHGGPTPRSKRYLYDSGVRVPLILHIPEKWRHLLPEDPTVLTSRLTSFEDFVPTLLAIAKAPPTDDLTGQSILSPRDESMLPGIFLSADRFDGITGMQRAVVVGNYKYIRDFLPFTPRAPYSFYPLQMPSWQAWQTAWEAGSLTPQHAAYWQPDHLAEELYDLRNDPHELHNLADNPDHAIVLKAMRKTLFRHMVVRRDTGIIPEGLFYPYEGVTTRYGQMRHPNFHYKSLLKFACNLEPTITDIGESAAAPDPLSQYWAAVHLTRDLSPELTPLRKNLSASPLTIVAAQACVALYHAGEKDAALAAFAPLFQREITVPEGIALVNACLQIKRPDIIPDPWKDAHQDAKNASLDLGRLLKSLPQKP